MKRFRTLLLTFPSDGDDTTRLYEDVPYEIRPHERYSRIFLITKDWDLHRKSAHYDYHSHVQWAFESKTAAITEFDGDFF